MKFLLKEISRFNFIRYNLMYPSVSLLISYMYISDDLEFNAQVSATLSHRQTERYSEAAMERV